MTDCWRRCSACKDPIGLGDTYWACNVSTCNRKRTALAFCSVDCWEVHLPGANHRQSWAVEKTAPRTPDEPSPSGAAKRRVVADTAPAPTSSASDEVLVVASRLKDYVKRSAGYNTSDRVLAPLSDIVRRVCDRAIQNARREGRMTVLDRDLPDDLEF